MWISSVGRRDLGREKLWEMGVDKCGDYIIGRNFWEKVVVGVPVKGWFGRDWWWFVFYHRKIWGGKGGIWSGFVEKFSDTFTLIFQSVSKKTSYINNL